MWPNLLDLDKDRCKAILRRLELEAYSSVVNALRAHGDLTKERRKILGDLCSIFSISLERHKTEIRRALNDETLNTIAKNGSGEIYSNMEWAKEGRRIIPLLERASPLTQCSTKADKTRIEGENHNRIKLSPAQTRTPYINKSTNLGNKGVHAPIALEDLLTEKGDGFQTQNISMPKKNIFLGIQEDDPSIYGDVVILPSGLAVRFKEESNGTSVISTEGHINPGLSSSPTKKNDLPHHPATLASMGGYIPPMARLSIPPPPLMSTSQRQSNKNNHFPVPGRRKRRNLPLTNNNLIDEGKC